MLCYNFGVEHGRQVMLIGREKELKLLREIYASEESSFVAVYGRRRIGKTYLIDGAFGGKLCFRHAGVYHGTGKEQLRAFASSLKDCGFPAEAPLLDWFSAFDALKDLIRHSGQRKKVIFLDEIAWMYTKKSNFIRALENFWNGWACARKDVMLIICSSATSWIINNIIHSKGGLYNRVTRQLSLAPFTLSECEEYCARKGLSLSRKQIIEAYMVIGGVPFYWDYLGKGQSIPQFIDSSFFAGDAPLQNEFKYIFASLFSEPEDYLRIISCLSLKQCGMTRKEILAESKLTDNGFFSQKLEDLKNCGFIREYSPLAYKKQSVVYQLIDPFVIFHYHFLAKRSDDKNYWANQLNTPLLNSWRGLAFERVCLLHSDSIKKALGISGVHTSSYPWSAKKDDDEGVFGSQIDMVIERKDDIIDLLEIKYYDSPYRLDSKRIEAFSKKRHDFATLSKTKSALHLVLLALNGVVENEYSKEIQFILSANDLFR